MAKKIISIAVSLGILAVIYHGLDWRAIFTVIADSHAGWLVAGLFLLVPTLLLTAARLALICPADLDLRFAEALGLTLFAGVLNMVLPSKMGDVVKAAFIQTHDARHSTLSLSLVVFEKALDVLSLLAWCCLGLFFYKRRDFLFIALTGLVVGLTFLTLVLLKSKHTGNWLNWLIARLPVSKIRHKLFDIQASWSVMQGAFWGHPAVWLRSLVISLLIWFLHLLQIWIFILALGRVCPFLECMGLAALAIFAGLLPFTLAGIGTRDAAIIFLFRDYLPKESGAALGLLCTLRYLLPAIAGLPTIQRYMGLLPGGLGRAKNNQAGKIS